MSLHIRVETPLPETVGSARVGPRRGPLLPESGPELDREIERRVLRKAPARAVPPFSTEDWTATALAQMVSRQTGWACEVSEQDATWSAIWIEYPNSSPSAPRQRILSMITASAPTRALAICRALIRATGCPRWPGVVRGGEGNEPFSRDPARSSSTESGSRNRH